MELLQPVRYKPGSTEAEWVQTKPLEERRVERHNKAVMVHSKIYGIAKLVHEILVAFGAEVDDTPTDIRFHIAQVESEVTNPSSTRLLEATEDLFYVLLARLDVEIQNIDLSQSFHFDIRSMKPSLRFLRKKCLPEPQHLRLIFEACRQLLKADHVCGHLNTELIRQQQADYIHQTMELGASAGYFSADPQGFRRYVQSLITDPNSPYRVKWSGLNPIYDSAPAMVLATLSEKYFGITAREKRTQKSEEEKQPPTTEPVDPEHEEIRHVMAHREAAYAMLHSMSVGEYRRQEGDWQLSEYVKEDLCICFGCCSCSRRCTVKGDRMCPCTGRLSSLCEEHEPDSKQSFIERCADLAVTLFERLSAIYRGVDVVDMIMDLDSGLESFHEEIIGYRNICERNMLHDAFDMANDFECRYLGGENEF